MKKTIVTLAILLQFSIANCQNSQKDFPVLKGPYLGQKAPETTPELFAENILAKFYESFHSTIVFNSLASECYWQCNLGDNRSAILWSKIDDDKWTLPEIATFARMEFKDDCPFISPDGKRMFFLSRRPLKEGEKIGKENIWVMDRIDGGWSEPKPLPQCINSMARIHWQISVDSNGNLYFSSTQMDSRGRRGDIFCSEYNNGTYSNPLKLETIINSPDYEFSPFISPDGSYLLFSRETYGDGNCLIYITFKTKEGKWSEPINLYDKYEIKGICPVLTKDEKYLFYLDYVNSRSQPFWISAKFIEELRPKE